MVVSAGIAPGLFEIDAAPTPGPTHLWSSDDSPVRGGAPDAAPKQIASDEPRPARTHPGPGDVSTLREVVAIFGEAFEDDAYARRPPSSAYLEGLLSQPSFIAIAGSIGSTLVGGLAGYVLQKFEQERSEIYIYDLAVSAAHRRRGVATAMIAKLAAEAAARGAWVVYVQADRGDDAAIALYSKLGTREDVLHFDIRPTPSTGDA